MVVPSNYRIISAALILGFSGGVKPYLLPQPKPVPVLTAPSKKPVARKKVPSNLTSEVRLPVVQRPPEVTYSIQSGAYEKDYDLHLTGQATCGTAYCKNIPLRLNVKSSGRSALEESGTTDAVGRYTFNLALRAEPNESLDWSLRVAPGYGQGEQEGRRILDEGSSAVINSQLTVSR